MIVSALRDLQNRHGYLPDAELRALAVRLGVPLARIEEVSTFFPAFRPERDKPATLEVRVCRDMTCHLRGADHLLTVGEKLARSLDPAGTEVRVEGVSCLGRCDRAPVAWAERQPIPEDEHAWVYANLTEKALAGLLRALAGGGSPPPDSDLEYAPHTNTAVIANTPVWEIDVYARKGWPRDYRGVRGFVEFLTAKRRRAVPRPPKGEKDLAKYVERNHPWLWRLRQAGLNGMGGALASAYQKWLDVWEQRSAEDDDTDQPLADQKPDLFGKYVVANGDESEPGTFKDREILLRLPHLMVEGVILAGLMVGASEGFVFIRHEYHEQIAAVRAEIERSERLGACGANVFGSGRAFPVTVIESPGGYICGEQSALLEAMEDRRAQPRNKPPEITTNGFRDRPTVLNNVETLAWVPHVMLSGDDKPTYPDLGWMPPSVPGGGLTPPPFGGKRLFSVSGDVQRPGVYEVPIGLPLGELLNDLRYCGGVVGTLKAVATSGPSGGFLPARLRIPEKARAKFSELRAGLKTLSPPRPLTFEEWFVLTRLVDDSAFLDVTTLPLDKAAFDWLKTSGIAPLDPLLGAGLAVYAGAADILDQAVNFTRFFRNESCGKCVPCRIGTQKLVQLGTGLMAKRDADVLAGTDVMAADLDLKDLKLALTQTSICSLGVSAPSPLATALAYFPADVKPT